MPTVVHLHESVSPQKYSKKILHRVASIHKNIKITKDRSVIKFYPKNYYLCEVAYFDFMTEIKESRLIDTIVEAIADKKGKNIVSLDLQGFDGAICSHFVVCNADSTTQVAAIADGIEEKVRETLGEKPWRIEGQQTALWIAVDYVDVVVHIFTTELRDFYRLEELWADAPMKRYEYEE